MYDLSSYNEKQCLDNSQNIKDRPTNGFFFTWLNSKNREKSYSLKTGFCDKIAVNIQSNFNGSNTFGTMKISSRQG